MADRIYEQPEVQYAFNLQNPAATQPNARPLSSVWAAGIPNSGSFYGLMCDPVDVDRDLKVVENQASFASRVRQAANVIVHASGSMAKFSIKEPFTYNYHDQLLYSHFQSVSEGADLPFAKTFTIASSMPRFDYGQGAMITLLVINPVAATSQKVSNGVCNSLKLSWKRNEYLQAEYGFVGKGAGTTTETTSSTTITALQNAAANYGMQHFNDIDSAAVDVGAGYVACTLGSCDIDSTFDVDLIGHDGAGSGSTFSQTGHTGKITFSVLKDSVAESLFTRSLTGGQILFRAYKGSTTGTGIGHIAITSMLRITGIKIVDDGVIYAEVSGEMLNGFTLVMSNSVDRAY